MQEETGVPQEKPAEQVWTGNQMDIQRQDWESNPDSVVHSAEEVPLCYLLPKFSPLISFALDLCLQVATSVQRTQLVKHLRICTAQPRICVRKSGVIHLQLNLIMNPVWCYGLMAMGQILMKRYVHRLFTNPVNLWRAQFYSTSRILLRCTHLSRDWLSSRSAVAGATFMNEYSWLLCRMWC